MGYCPFVRPPPRQKKSVTTGLPGRCVATGCAGQTHDRAYVPAIGLRGQLG